MSDAADTDAAENQRILKTLWHPHAGQRAILDHAARFKVVACGRRWGKSEMAGHAALTEALENPGATVWWVAPSYQQANSYGFDKITPLLSPDVLAESPKRSKPREIALNNGSTLSFRSADREDSLRGGGVDYLVIDEAGSVPERAWTEELRPALSDTLGSLLAIGTPRGRNWFYRWYQRGQSADHADVASWQAPSKQNPHVPDSEIEDASGDMPERVFKQEYRAEFLDESGGVFRNIRASVEDYPLPVPGPEKDARAQERSDSPERGLVPIPSETREAFEERKKRHESSQPRNPGAYGVGVDFARMSDWTVAVVLDAEGRLVAFNRLRETTWTRIQSVVERLAAEYAPNIVALDATRDNKIVQDLRDAGIQVDPVSFGGGTKRTLIENLITAFESGEITLSSDADQLINELEVFEYGMNDSGSVSYSAPTGFHDDAVDALALAQRARNRGGVDRVETVTVPSTW